MIVLDASVAAKWLLSEPGSQEAVALQEGPDELFGPDLIRMEVAAAITRRVRDKEKPLPAAEVVRRCARWFRLLDQATIYLLPESELLEEAIQLAVKIPHTLQDCLYLAAALRLDAALVTADRRFHDRVKPFYKKISMLTGCERN